MKGAISHRLIVTMTFNVWLGLLAIGSFQSGMLHGESIEADIAMLTAL